MNHVFFACRTCKSYIDAGYRWAAWTLEQPRVVRRGVPVDVAAVLRAESYWAGGSEGWLAEQLPRVRRFLVNHSSHDVVFDEDESFRPINATGCFLDWLDDYVVTRAELSPRYFVKRLGLERWEDVVAFVGLQGRA